MRNRMQVYDLMTSVAPANFIIGGGRPRLRSTLFPYQGFALRVLLGGF